ncbi:MAG: TPM domain-containing protein [Lachnospiraceae bacterium]|nr:TPM domain-containing protein [Lachnospiraceae bacterium]
MLQYLKRTWIFYSILAVLLLIYGVLILAGKQKFTGFTRGNNACDGVRVFDNADLLSDDEEALLQNYIEDAQDKVGCDIIVMTLNESIKDYAIADQGYEIDESRYVMVYADNFYDEHAFGYDIPHGDGCILLDNWNREDSVYGYAYNWISTSGRMIHDLDQYECQEILDDVNEYVNDNPLKAYKIYVDGVVREMMASDISIYKPGYGLLAILATIFTVVLFFIFYQNEFGKKTTGNDTYLKKGGLSFNRKADVLEHTHVSRRHIERSSGGSGGGGGGSHVSSGGFSHGGGGGHH